MARRRPDLQLALAEFDAVAMDEIAVGADRAAIARQRDLAAELALQHPRAGDVVGMDMGLERPGEAEPELGHQRRVAPHLLKYRIDEHRLAGLAVAEQVGVSRRGRVEQLAEDQHRRVLRGRFLLPANSIPAAAPRNRLPCSGRPPMDSPVRHAYSSRPKGPAAVCRWPKNAPNVAS